MKTITPIQAVCVIAVFLTSVPRTQAQYSKMSSQEILRQAQERQRAIDKIGEDFRKNATDVLEREQRRAQEEREDRRRQQDQDRDERAAEQQRRQEEQRQVDLQRSIQQTQEAQRQQQQVINTIVQNGQRTAAQPSYQATPKATSQPQNDYQPSSTRRQEVTAEVSRSTAPEKPSPSALGGSPNDQGLAREGWSRWQPLSENIWVSYTRVQNKFENGKPLWTWSLRNWNDRAVKTIWFEYYEKGAWRKDLTPFTLNPRASHGGWGSFTAVGETAPIFRITEVDFK